MSKFILIYAHPRHDGHCAYLLSVIEKLLKERNESYELLDLYQMNYNPVLTAEELQGEISPENKIIQTKISDSQYLIFIYPTCWQNMPAILKGFVDRVFSRGFAFKYENSFPVGLLKGHKAVVFTSTGAPKFINLLLNRRRSLKVLVKDTLSFCGIKTRGFSIGSARKMAESKKLEIGLVAEAMLDFLK